LQSTVDCSRAFFITPFSIIVSPANFGGVEWTARSKVGGERTAGFHSALVPLFPPLTTLNQSPTAVPHCSWAFFITQIFDYCIAHNLRRKTHKSEGMDGRVSEVGESVDGRPSLPPLCRSLLHTHSKPDCSSALQLGFFLSLEFLIIVSRILPLSTHLSGEQLQGGWMGGSAVFCNSHGFFLIPIGEMAVEWAK
jgi:hypothetical protein